ncbi:hypothetical protein AB4Y32_10185 [Paraburkholderia phymatum]|uniref:Uncharacterized protein n=1 Tax=Paraburkholderia phymatum TaxID=148447 RepID=A0ACC6TXU3_9BURK
MPKKNAVPSATKGERSPPPRGKNPSFLSILKAVYRATKLYIALLVTFAGVPIVVIREATSFGVPEWLAYIFSAIPALLISLWLVPAWREQRNKRIATERGIHGQIKDPEYFRLTPYDSAADFRRADNVHEKVYEWLMGNPAPLLYLSGASGSGKSSIISAWVVPKLAREGVLTQVVSARIVGNPISAVTQALLKPGVIWERPPTGGNESLRDMLERAGRRIDTKKLLLVLDQFEEFLILADDAQRDAFTALLHSLAERPVRNLQVLMILRSDYRALLDTLGLPEIEKDRKEVPAFLERDAMTFLRNSGLTVSPILETEIREEAREVEQTPGLIRPVTINLFGMVVGRFEALPKNYRRGTLLRSYLRDLIERKDIRDFAPSILRCMMTGNGTKQPVSCADIARTVGLSPAQVRGHLVPLASEGIVRELDPKQGKWEIAHDFIAGLYHQILAGWRVSAWRRARPWVIGGGTIIWLVGIFAAPFLIPTHRPAAVNIEVMPDTISLAPCYYLPVAYLFKEVNGVPVSMKSETVKWITLDGREIYSEKMVRIFGGSFTIPGKGNYELRDNIYLPPAIANYAKSIKAKEIELVIIFNGSDDSGRSTSVESFLRIAMAPQVKFDNCFDVQLQPPSRRVF